MAPKTSNQAGESKQGLIITLVFFVLATIGLGISTYTGYTADDGKDKKLKDLEAKLKTMTNDRDWFRFQSSQFKSYMGHLREADEQTDLKSARDKFDSNAFGEEKERPALKQLLDAIDPKVKWVKASGKPELPYETLLVNERKRIEELEGVVAKLNAEKKRAEDEVAKARDDLDGARKNFADELKKFTDKLANENTSLTETVATQVADKARLAAAHNEDLKKKAAELEKAVADRAQLAKGLQDTSSILQERTKELSTLKNKDTDAPQDWRTDWKIVEMAGRRADQRTDIAYINLGSADLVNDQLTFSVHAIDPSTHKPVMASKGSVEVISVVGPHLSQARITEVKNADRDPVLPGDVLYNPTWNPNIRRHVAIAGIIDLTGEGRDQVAEFKRNLERQNVIVDAWLDLREMNIKGPGITVKTDYLILGEGADVLAPSLSATADSPGSKLEARTGKMLEDAKKSSVTVIGLRKYLEMIGYRSPRLSTAERTYFHLPFGGASDPTKEGKEGMPQDPLKEPMPKEPMPKEPMPKEPMPKEPMPKDPSM